ncbi:MAG: hypothetical protein ACOVOJ_06890, partial [Pirellula sp.]
KQLAVTTTVAVNYLIARRWRQSANNSHARRSRQSANNSHARRSRQSANNSQDTTHTTAPILHHRLAFGL